MMFVVAGVCCGWVGLSVCEVGGCVCEVGGCVCEYLTVDVSIAYRCRFVLADYNMSCDDVRVNVLIITFINSTSDGCS